MLQLKDKNLALTEKVSELNDTILSEKQKYHELWWVNCMQLRECDETLQGKDAETEQLTRRVAELEGGSLPWSASPVVVRESHIPKAARATIPRPAPPLLSQGKSGEVRSRL